MFIRVDNRLIHGQIIEGWLPYLKSSCIVVVNDEVANDPFRKMILEMAVPSDIDVAIYTIEEFSNEWSHFEANGKGTIVLFENIEDVLISYTLGLHFGKLNIGNVPSEEGKVCFTPSIFLNEQNVKDLMYLMASGIEVEVRCVPRDKPIDFREVAKKIRF